MPAFLQNPGATVDTGWVTLREAAERLGEPLRTLTHRARTRWAPRGLAELRPPPGRKGRPAWRVHRRADPRLGLCPAPSVRDERSAPGLRARYAQHAVDRALRRAYWLGVWRRAIAANVDPCVTERDLAVRVANEALAVEGPDFRIGPRSLVSWRRAYNMIGQDGHILGAAGLVDRYGVGPQAEPGRSPEAVAFFQGIYHSPAKHSVKVCHLATVDEGKRRRWAWPPSYAATVKWLRATERRDLTCLHRDGHRAYAHKHMEHLVVDYCTIEPGERYVCDHTPCDFWVVHRGRQIRPWLTAVEDCRSRCIVGWHLGITPHQDSVVAAFRRAFQDWAICQQVHIDNGSDWVSKLLTGWTKRECREHRRELGRDWQQRIAHECDVRWTGILGELGVEIQTATRFHAWAKGLIERWFSTFEDQCGKTFTTYCGNKPDNKPECVDIMRAGPDVATLDEARQRVASWIALYHRTPHGGDGMSGLAPIAVWGTASRLRKAGVDELMALMDARGVYKVGPNGVRFKIGGDVLRFGATSARLRQYAGRDVFITLDPDHCECCYAFTADRAKRRFIDRLEPVLPIPVNTSAEELREAIRALRSRNKHLDAAVREAPKRMRTAAHEVAALRRHQLAELRKTGTYGTVARANVIPVLTGFEGTSIPVRRGTESVDVPPAPQECDLFDRLGAFTTEPEPPKDSGPSVWDRLQTFNRSKVGGA